MRWCVWETNEVPQTEYCKIMIIKAFCLSMSQNLTQDSAFSTLLSLPNLWGVTVTERLLTYYREI